MKSQIIALFLFFCLYSSYSKYYPAEYDLRFEPDYRNCDFQASEEVNLIYFFFKEFKL